VSSVATEDETKAVDEPSAFGSPTKSDGSFSMRHNSGSSSESAVETGNKRSAFKSLDSDRPTTENNQDPIADSTDSTLAHLTKAFAVTNSDATNTDTQNHNQPLIPIAAFQLTLQAFFI